MTYLLKLLGAKSMRSIVSLVVIFIAPPQTKSPKPAVTLRLDRAVQTGGKHKRPPILIEVYLPTTTTTSSAGNGISKELPIVINLHGSGFLLNTFGDDARFCQLMAEQVDCAVFDVAYSKAPENPYPCANEDVEGVLEWISENVALNKKLKECVAGVRVHSDRVALTGFSSGGNLVLTTCVRAKEKGNLEVIKAVVAFYPSTNLAESPYAKPKLKPGKGEAGGVMPPFVRQFLYSCYTPSSQDTSRSSATISPISAPADAFPPSVTIITCEGDSLAREGRQMADNVRESRNTSSTSSAPSQSYIDEQGTEQKVSNGVLWWEAKGQGHNWDKMCKEGSGAATKRDFAYKLASERLKAALCAD
ncbi:hypothetical protein CBS101457_001799 [Exobasidium rhododendri]|nr:hypothetical protein CBS101457_001799 [Exobasidium rhododendri]